MNAYMQDLTMLYYGECLNKMYKRSRPAFATPVQEHSQQRMPEVWRQQLCWKGLPEAICWSNVARYSFPEMHAGIGSALAAADGPGRLGKAGELGCQAGSWGTPITHTRFVGLHSRVSAPGKR